MIREKDPLHKLFFVSYTFPWSETLVFLSFTYTINIKGMTREVATVSQRMVLLSLSCTSSFTIPYKSYFLMLLSLSLFLISLFVFVYDILGHEISLRPNDYIIREQFPFSYLLYRFLLYTKTLISLYPRSVMKVLDGYYRALAWDIRFSYILL